MRAGRSVRVHKRDEGKPAEERRVTERKTDGGRLRLRRVEGKGWKHKGSSLKIVSLRDRRHNEDDKPVVFT